MTKSGYIIYLVAGLNVVVLVQSVATDQPGNAPSWSSFVSDIAYSSLPL